jgi:hypothetical protein
MPRTFGSPDVRADLVDLVDEDDPLLYRSENRLRLGRAPELPPRVAPQPREHGFSIPSMLLGEHVRIDSDDVAAPPRLAEAIHPSTAFIIVVLPLPEFPISSMFGAGCPPRCLTIATATSRSASS